MRVATVARTFAPRGTPCSREKCPSMARFSRGAHYASLSDAGHPSQHISQPDPIRFFIGYSEDEEDFVLCLTAS